MMIEMWCEVEPVQKFYPISFSSFFFAFQVCNTTTDRNHADPALEKYVTETVMAIVKGFFSSPFSVNHANLQVLFFTSGKQVKWITAHPNPMATLSYFIVKKIFDSWLSPPLHRHLYLKQLLEVFYADGCTNGSYQRQWWSVPIRIISVCLHTLMP